MGIYQILLLNLLLTSHFTIFFIYSAPKQQKLDAFAVIKYPLTTESAMKKIEDHNTLVFIVDVRSNKKQIKELMEEGVNLFHVPEIKDDA